MFPSSVARYVVAYLTPHAFYILRMSVCVRIHKIILVIDSGVTISFFFETVVCLPTVGYYCCLRLYPFFYDREQGFGRPIFDGYDKYTIGMSFDTAENPLTSNNAALMVLSFPYLALVNFNYSVWSPNALACIFKPTNQA